MEVGTRCRALDRLTAEGLLALDHDEMKAGRLRGRGIPLPAVDRAPGRLATGAAHPEGLAAILIWALIR